jgi:iron complex outermembrane recepter protein
MSLAPIRCFPPCVLALAIATLSVPSLAAPKKKADVVETVYVSATRSETAQMPVATQIKIISAEDIRISGAKLISEVLRTQAGIQLTDADGSGARNVTASMRGLSGANNVLVLVDGRKLNNPSLAAPALNTVALKDVERIEIVQGSAGVLYGDQAVGGVINIITRRAVVGEVHGSVSATTGTDNLEDYTASVNQGFENGLSYSLSGQKRNADNYRVNNQNAYENALANLRYDFAQGFVFVEGQRVNDELRLAGSITDAQALLDRRTTFSPNDYANQYTEVSRLGAGYNLSQGWALQAEYSDRNEEVESFNYGLSEYSVRVKSFTPRVIGNFAVANGTSLVTLGIDDVVSDYESTNSWSRLDSQQKQQSYYAQVVYPVLSQLTLITGARLAQVEDTNNAKARAQDDELTASELGLSYDLGNAWRVFGRYAESFRFGNIDENNLVAANVIFLDPQIGKSFELGAEFEGNTTNVSYTLYRLNINDEIVFDSLQYANINLPDSERVGAMVDVNTQLSKELMIRLNYTYTDAEIVDGEYKGKTSPFVAENTASVTLTLMPVESISVNVESLYTGSRYHSYDEANSAPKLDGLTVFNVSLLHQCNAWDFSLRVNNLTNELYAGLHGTRGQYPQPERNYQAGVSYRF